MPNSCQGQPLIGWAGTRTIKEIYGKKRGAEKNQIQADEKLKEQLRALGYFR